MISLYCNDCKQDHGKKLAKWCDRSIMEIENEKLKKALEIAKENLGFYASPIEWDYDNKDKEGEFCEIAVTDMEWLNTRVSIGGYRARQALKEIEGILK